MGAIAGGINIKKTEVDEMLEKMIHRGKTRKCVVWPDNIIFATNIMSDFSESKCDQLIMDDENALVFNGEIYNRLELEKSNHIYCEMNNDAHVLFELLQNKDFDYNDLNGQFTFAYMNKTGTVRLVRDYPGITPLFYSCENGMFAYASETKALESIGFNNIEVVAPGTEIVYRNGAINAHSWFKMKPRKFEHTIEQLDDMLRQAVKKQMEHHNSQDKIGVMVSGGLDSALLAYYAKCFNKNVIAFTIDGIDNEYAKALCEALSLKQVIIDAVPEYIEKSRIYQSDKYNKQFHNLNNSLFVPTYIIAENARKYGINILLSGDGIDELFDGYDLYEDYKGRLNYVLQSMVNSMHLFSLERLDLACMAHSIEPRVPFLSRNIIEAAFSINEEYKDKAEGDKWIIRKIAEKYIPKQIAWKKKSPMQTSTNSYKTIYNKQWVNTHTS